MSIDKKDLSCRDVHDPYDVYGLMNMLLNLKDRPDLTKENFWTVSLDIDRMILNVELVAMCSYLDTASIPSEVFNMPLQKKAYGIVLVHNSPTGVLDPREEDIDLTDRLIQVGNIIRINILDHLIIKENSYYSFQGSGLMDELRLSKRYAIPSLAIGSSVKREVATKRRKNDKSHLIDQYIEEEINQIK